jgi:beta-glucosidase
MSASAATAQPASTTARAGYLDASMPIPTRVADLLGRMTLAEKIGL